MKQFILTTAFLVGATVLGTGEIADASHRDCDYGYSLRGPVYYGSSHGLSAYAPSRNYYFYYSRPYYYNYDGFDSSYNSRYYGRYGSPYYSGYSSPYYSRYGYGYSRPGVSIYFGSGGYSRYGYGG